ncbi:hypothetical protein [Streptomyces sp. URMC 129]|uniref:hypothetical protein n=1 Tax=Streptomyces sp. URMC 129 TaxID=3423407 RepID=UPI003F1CE729
MTMRGSRVQIGAVKAAWDQASALRSEGGPAARAAFASRIAAATVLYGEGELARGTVFLLGGALTALIVDADGSEVEQFHTSFTETLMTKLARYDVEPGDLSMVRQVVTAALEGRDPVAWRDQAGRVPDSERRALTYALALVADFVDRADGPGACERGLTTALGAALD